MMNIIFFFIFFNFYDVKEIFESADANIVKKNQNKTATKQQKPEERNKKSDRVTEIELDIPKENKITSNDEDNNTENILSLKIDDVNEPDVDEFNIPYRSKYTGNEIRIYQKHPSFQLKLNEINGIPVVSESLITYLAAEIVMYYQIIFSDAKDDQQYSIDKALSDYLTSVYEFEKYLKDLKGKNLNDIS